MQTSKYLLATKRDAEWGLTISTVGREEIAPGEAYPTKGHADGYYFDLQKGRILDALYEEAYKTAQEEVAFAQQTMAGIVNHLIGKMYSLERNIVLSKDTKHVDMINKARLRIRESLEDTLTIQEIAQELGISYSSFRKLFKEHTGFAPALYQQNLKLQRAKELLSTTDESIKEIAYRLNFESPDYFSAKFKIQTGMKPSDFRNMTR